MSKSAKYATLLLVVIFGAVLGLKMFNGYGEVSPRTYEFAKAIYAACLSKSNERLERVESMLTNSSDSQTEIPDKQREWLQGMVDLAKRGRWDTAANQARQMMEDQVEY